MKQNMLYLTNQYQLRESIIVRMYEIIQQNKHAKKNGIVFFGDSIIEYYDVNTYYPEYQNVYNCGIHGITSTMLLHFLDEGVIQYEPSHVLLLIGTNDLGNTEMKSPREIALNVKEMVEIIHENLKDCKIHLISPLPCDEMIHGYEQKESIRNNYMLKAIFKEYQKMIHYSYVDFIDVFDLISQEDLVDGLHINQNSYQKITQKIKEYL